MVHCGFIFQKEMKVIHQDIKVMVIKMKNIVPKGAKCNDNTKNSEKKNSFWIKVIKQPEYMPICRKI